MVGLRHHHFDIATEDVLNFLESFLPCKVKTLCKLNRFTILCICNLWGCIAKNATRRGRWGKATCGFAIRVLYQALVTHQGEELDTKPTFPYCFFTHIAYLYSCMQYQCFYLLCANHSLTRIQMKFIKIVKTKLYIHKELRSSSYLTV